MTLLDIEKLSQTPLERDPYDHVIVPHFVRAEHLEAVIRDFPDVPGPGSHPPAALSISGTFAALLAELDEQPFKRAIETKFGIDLNGRPTMFTVRGYCRPSDGRIHNDSETKIITVLLYLNQLWDADGGRLRVLRGPADMDDMAAEIPPHGGTLFVFRRSDNSWHGHEPFEGRRRAIQMNWVTDAGVVAREQRRHRVSTFLKKLNPYMKVR